MALRLTTFPSIKLRISAPFLAPPPPSPPLQVLGGAGYTEWYPVERLWRDAKLLEIGGGTLESHQKNITRDLIRSLQ